MEIMNFTYKSNEYQAIIKQQNIGHSIHFKFTIMNGDLESLMYNCNKVIFENGEFNFNDQATIEQQKVLCSVCRSILQLINEPVIF